MHQRDGDARGAGPQDKGGGDAPQRRERRRRRRRARRSGRHLLLAAASSAHPHLHNDRPTGRNASAGLAAAVAAAAPAHKASSTHPHAAAASASTMLLGCVITGGGAAGGDDSSSKATVSDGKGRRYATSLDRNRYGGDDNYLATVVRGDLELLGLCPCLVDVEVVDAKTGRPTSS